jgi:hypothetical protein
VDYQKFQISLIWIEENSYYISTEVLQGVRRTLQGHKKKRKKIAGGMKDINDSNDSASPSPLFFAKEFVV